jgi:hypothetical protein
MNWDWFYALYSISAAFMVIGFLWKLTMIPLALISLAFNGTMNRVYMFIVMLIPYYFLACFAAVIGLGVNDGKRSILILTIGGIFLLLYGLMGIVEAQREAEKSFDFEGLRIINYRYFGVLLGLAFYVYTIFDIRIAINSTTIWLGNAVKWIQDLPIIGWILALMAFLYAAYMIVVGVIAIISMVAGLIPRRQPEVHLPE